MIWDNIIVIASFVMSRINFFKHPFGSLFHLPDGISGELLHLDLQMALL